MDTLGRSVLSVIRRLSLLRRFYITCIQLLAGGTQFVYCREVVRSSECPPLEVALYTKYVRQIIMYGGSTVSSNTVVL